MHAAVIVAFALLAAMMAPLAILELKHVPAPALVLLGLCLFTLLQAVPLPLRVLAALDAGNADVWARSLRPFGEAAPTWAPLSIDPSATVLESAKWFIYASVFMGAVAVSRRRSFHFVAVLLFASGIAVAVITMVHSFAGATRVYGFYSPQFAVARRHIGPLLNPNNLGGYLNLSAMCGLGLLAARNPPLPRWASVLGTLVLVGAAVRAASRAGVACLVIGVLAFGLTLAIVHAPRNRTQAVARTRTAFAFAAVLFGGLLLALAGETTEIWQDLSDRGMGKVTMWLWTRNMTADHFWFGVGRGAFETAFSPYRGQPFGANNVVLTHPENILVQWATEWGVPVTVAALATFSWLFRPWKLKLSRGATRLSMALAVAILFVQNLADLGLEVAGVAAAAAACLGAVWHDTKGDTLAAAAPAVSRYKLPALVAAIGAALALLPLVTGARTVQSDRARIAALYDSTNVKDAGHRAALRSDLRSAMRRHPGEPYFPLVGGLLAFRAADQNALPWIERVLERDVFSGRGHLLLANVLARRGALNQALMELRLAAETDAATRGHVGRAAAKWTQRFEDLMRAVPIGTAGSETILAIVAALPFESQWNVRTSLLREAVNRSRAEPSYRLSLAEELLRHIDGRGPGCRGDEREACLTELSTHAKALNQTLPQLTTGPEIQARVLVARERAAEADRLLERECSSRQLAQSCFRLRVRTALDAGEPQRLEKAVEAFRAAACATPESCASELSWIAELMEQRQNWAAAMLYHSRAARDAPTRARWLKVHAAAKRAGADSLAEDALKHAEASANQP